MLHDHPKNPTAIRVQFGAIFVSLELSRKTWLITSLSPGKGEKMSKHAVTAGDIAGLMARFAELRRKAAVRTGKSFPIIAIQEAGLDGFWLHRVLQQEGIESHVVDPASIAIPRRRRRAKTDKIDGEALLRALLAYKRGEPRVCSMVIAPSPEEEDRRRLCRERDTLITERVRHVNRIKGLLFAQGIAGYEPVSRNRRKRLDELCTGDGRPLPQYVKAQISRELDRLELVLEQIKTVEKERDRVLLSPAPVAAVNTGPEAACDNPTGASGVAMLTALRGIGANGATKLWS
jgi:transposase